MRWVAPPEKDAGTDTLEKRLWDAADQLRANSGLSAAQYSQPVLGLIFLRFAEARFNARRAALEKQAAGSRRGSRLDDASAYHAEGVLYLEPAARFEHLLKLPEGAAVGEAVNAAMRAIERDNPQLAGVLPKTYEIFTSTLLKECSRRCRRFRRPSTTTPSAASTSISSESARTEGQKGGEFYTPSSIVRLLVEVIEPFHGRILNPACGSGGMFVQSARFVAEHKKNPASELSIHGQEKTAETTKLCRMNLAVHGLEGDIRQANSYYEDLQSATGPFDFVLANPPFNANAIDKECLEGDVRPGRRFPFGLPRADNGN
jgi:type I restriction enzyme M protein